MTLQTFTLGTFAQQGVAAGDFDSIATTIVGAGGAATVTFSSIPNTYTHLQIRGIAKDTGTGQASTIRMKYNSDSGNNYTEHAIYGSGSVVAVEASASIAYNYFYTGSAQIGSFVVDVLDYKNTNKFKTTKILTGSDRNGSDGLIGLFSGLWQNTNAITQIDITSSGTFAQYSSFALYGIKAA